MRKLIVAAGGGLLAAIGAMLISQNEPGYWVRELVAPVKRSTGFDLFVLDHYFVFDPTLLLVNCIIFSGVAYAFVWLGLRVASARGHGRSGA